ncbi:MAG: glutathione S-transferase [Acidiferrobacter sp.]
MKVYHFWFEAASERARLALSFKSVSYELIVPDYDDDETFFDLGVARLAPVVRWDDGGVHAGGGGLLTEIDRRYPTPSLFAPLTAEQWQSLCDWRTAADPILERLYAPIRPAYRGIGDSGTHLASYKASVQARFGTSLEDLANDRYAVYAQLDSLTRLKELGAYVAKHGFYAGTLSAADILLTADLFPLQLLDGVTLPIGLMYYFERVQESCRVNLRDGLIADS